MELHPILSSKGMNSPFTQFVTPSRFGIYEPIHQIGTWGESFKSNGNPNASTPIVEVDTKLDTQVKTIDIYSTSSDRREVEHSYLPTSTNKKQVNLWIKYKDVLHKTVQLLVKANCGKSWNLVD